MNNDKKLIIKRLALFMKKTKNKLSEKNTCTPYHVQVFFGYYHSGSLLMR